MTQIILQYLVTIVTVYKFVYKVHKSSIEHMRPLEKPWFLGTNNELYFKTKETRWTEDVSAILNWMLQKKEEQLTEKAIRGLVELNK